MKRLSSSDPFIATYQLEDGTILVTNQDLSQGLPDPDDDTEPPVIPWTGPDEVTRDVCQGEMIVYFFDSVAQDDIEDFILDHNLYIVMSWFEAPSEGRVGNNLAWFHFRYDQNEFATMDDAYSYFSTHPLIASAWPAFVATDKGAYRFIDDVNDHYYGLNENSYVNILGVDDNEWILPGPENGGWYSDQYVVVIDDGVWRGHPEFWIPPGRPWAGYGKITWVGVNCTKDNYWVGYHYGEPNVIDPNRGTLATHGTMVAGMLTATTNDTRGVASLAPGHAVMPVRMKVKWYWNGQEWEDRIDQDNWVKAVRALRFQFAHDQWLGKFRVVNMSFGGPRPWYEWMYPSTRYNLKKNINDDLKRSDRLYVAAAGNDYSSERNYPAALDNVLGVSGLFTNRQGSAWYHWYGTAGWGSNYRNDNYATYPVSGVCDFTEVYSPPYPWVGRSTSVWRLPYPNYENYYNYWYEHFNGTSAATPEVAALAAALYGHEPNYMYTSIWNRIVNTRDNTKARGYVAGLVDYDAALEGW